MDGYSSTLRNNLLDKQASFTVPSYILKHESSAFR